MNGWEPRQPLTESPESKTTSGLAAQSSNNLRHSVELHIEELVLHGFDPAHRYRISEVIQRELTRLFEDHGANDAIAQRREITRLDGGVFEVQPGSNSEMIGTHLARAIYGGLSR